jgi:hypothetical protein
MTAIVVCAKPISAGQGLLRVNRYSFETSAQRRLFHMIATTSQTRPNVVHSGHSREHL